MHIPLEVESLKKSNSITHKLTEADDGDIEQ